MNVPETIEQRTEALFIRMANAVGTHTEMLHTTMCPMAHSISDGHVTAKSRNALLDALAKLEDQCALFRWAVANAAIHSPNADPKAESDVGLIVHSRGQSAFDFIEGHAIALIELVSRMRETGETREDVLDTRQHAKRLVEFGKDLDLPRKPRANPQR